MLITLIFTIFNLLSHYKKIIEHLILQTLYNKKKSNTCSKTLFLFE